MAEIKSTMDLVMERMAKMTERSESVSTDEDMEKAGMRTAAMFLDQKSEDLIAELSQQPAESQKAVFRGAAQTLLRNIVLPRDEIFVERTERALNGIAGLAQALGATSVSQICSELQQILQQYNQHKEQVTQQLEDALVQQMQQQLAGRGVDPSEIRASMHPKYGEEMSKMELELNGQYLEAMDQRKEMILQQMGLG